MGNRPARQYYTDAAQRTMLVQRVCRYFRAGGQECNGCPEWEPTSNGPVKRMCRAMAEELIAVVHEAVALGPEVITQDNEPRQKPLPRD